MELEFADGSKVIINRHVPNQEMWLAAKSGGFHYGYQGANGSASEMIASCLASWGS